MMIIVAIVISIVSMIINNNINMKISHTSRRHSISCYSLFKYMDPLHELNSCSVPPVGPGHSAALGEAVWESQRVRSWIFCGEHLFRLCDYLLHRLELFDDGHPSRLDGDTHR